MLMPTLALALAVSQPATHLAIAPWTGAAPRTATATAAKYRLTVTGAPHAALTLKATHLARGWLGAFCTPLVCAPASVDVTLPASGKALYTFELIREEDSAPRTSAAQVVSSDGAVLSIPAATAKR